MQNGWRRFKVDDWIILGLPDGGQRLVQLKLDSIVDLGRFGQFSINQLIDTVPGLYYKVDHSGQIATLDPRQLQLVGIASDQDLSTNQILSDTNTSQRLCTKDIEELKTQAELGQLTPNQLVETVIQNSETFSTKNAYSQQKYVQRKRQKFLRWFHTSSVNLRTLCQYFMNRDARKIHDLRLDSISQIICLANIQVENSRCLIWDETNGFLTGALLSHMTGDDLLLLHVHPDRQMQISFLSYFNLGEGIKNDCLLSVSIDQINHILTSKNDSSPEGDFKSQPVKGLYDEQQLAIQKVRFMERRARKKKIHDLMVDAKFDSLVIATSQADPLLLIQQLAPFLRPSAKVIVYSTYRELLFPAYSFLRKDNNYLDVALTQSWMRPYQAAPGRLHPFMNCSGHTGAILSATKILQTPKPPLPEKKSVKLNEIPLESLNTNTNNNNNE